MMDGISRCECFFFAAFFEDGRFRYIEGSGGSLRFAYMSLGEVLNWPGVRFISGRIHADVTARGTIDNVPVRVRVDETVH